LGVNCEIYEQYRTYSLRVNLVASEEVDLNPPLLLMNVF